MDRRRWLTAGLIVAGHAATPATAAAQQLATVAVKVELVARRFKDRFGPERPRVEAAAARLFTEFLREQVGYLRFVPGDSAARQRLTFLLDRRERDTQVPFVDVGFWARLDLPDGSRQEKYWVTLRPADQATAGVGTEAELLAEIKTKLVHTDPAPLRDELLRHVSITERALPHASPLGFALPFRSPDLCMKTQSVLSITNELQDQMGMEAVAEVLVVGAFQPPGQPGPQQQPFVGGVFGTLKSSPLQQELSSSIRAGRARVKQVFVTGYRHDPVACRHRLTSAGGVP